MSGKPAFQIEIEAKFDAADIAMRTAQKSGDAQQMLDSQVLADSNYFCPMKTSTLQKSAIVYTRIGSGEVVWKTPYAKAQYYGENFDHSKQNNPNACTKWFEAAKARWEKNWERLVNEYIKRG